MSFNFFGKRDRPIYSSHLDTDFYLFPMWQLAHEKFPRVPVKYAFTNRTKSVKLGNILDMGELREHLDEARKVRFGNTDLHYLLGTNEYGMRMFSDSFLSFLKGYRLPEYNLEVVDGELMLEFYGAWEDIMPWELPGLEIPSELYSRHLMKGLSRIEQEAVYATGVTNLVEKVRLLKQNRHVTFSDFGTRRRFSRRWQDYAVGVLVEELHQEDVEVQQFKGTSNVKLASKYNQMPTGTNAHQMPMVYSGIYYEQDELDPMHSQRQFLDDWEARYGLALSIFLPDTFGTKPFMRLALDPERAARWKGSRQDSGDPKADADLWIEYYRRHGIDPAQKLKIFSDGLNVPKMIDIANYAAPRIIPTFGLGTNLTNDVGFSPLSLVIKAAEANGHSLVKLSDNLRKAIGPRAEQDRMIHLVGYEEKFEEDCKY